MIENTGSFVASNLMTLREKGFIEKDTIYAAGGLSELAPLLRYISDVTSMKIHRFASRESTARGAALAAMIAYGHKEDVAELNQEAPSMIIEPSPFSGAIARHQQWLELQDRVIGKAIEA